MHEFLKEHTSVINDYCGIVKGLLGLTHMSSRNKIFSDIKQLHRTYAHVSF